MHITGSVSRPPGSSNGAKSNEDRSLLVGSSKKRSCCDVAIVSIADEGAMSTGTTCMDSSLRDLNKSDLV